MEAAGTSSFAVETAGLEMLEPARRAADEPSGMEDEIPPPPPPPPWSSPPREPQSPGETAGLAHAGTTGATQMPEMLARRAVDAPSDIPPPWTSPPRELCGDGAGRSRAGAHGCDESEFQPHSVEHDMEADIPPPPPREPHSWGEGERREAERLARLREVSAGRFLTARVSSCVTLQEPRRLRETARGSSRTVWTTTTTPSRTDSTTTQTMRWTRTREMTRTALTALTTETTTRETSSVATPVTGRRRSAGRSAWATRATAAWRVARAWPRRTPSTAWGTAAGVAVRGSGATLPPHRVTDLNFFDSAQCLMVRRSRLIGHFPILYNPTG
jgi:hypothetical protein